MGKTIKKKIPGDFQLTFSLGENREKYETPENMPRKEKWNFNHFITYFNENPNQWLFDSTMKVP